jgi:hypothetical protein
MAVLLLPFNNTGLHRDSVIKRIVALNVSNPLHRDSTIRRIVAIDDLKGSKLL